MKMVEVPEFDAARIRAIEAYGHLEAHQAMMLHKICGLDFRAAKSIVSRVSSTRSRYAIISDLISRSNPEIAEKYWKKIKTRLTSMDDRRNRIVHWVAVVDGDADRKFLLDPRKLPSQAGMDTAEILAFTQEAHDLCGLFMDALFAAHGKQTASP